MDLRLIVAKCVGLNGDEGLIEVSISGHPGSGTSTLVHKLSEHFGWKFMNGGDVFRNEAANRSLSLPPHQSFTIQKLFLQASGPPQSWRRPF